MVFSHESRFCLGMDDGCCLLFAVERPIHRIIRVMVWGAIGYGSRSPLVFIRGSVTSECYINDVLEPLVLPYLNGLHQLIFQQDYARRHIARRTL
jgi:hypothetical protein